MTRTSRFAVLGAALAGLLTPLLVQPAQAAAPAYVALGDSYSSGTGTRSYIADGASVVVVPAGERWYDDTLRPAVEDLWGAGAVLAALEAADEVISPEARMAVAAWRAVRLPDDVLRCASGIELTEAGFVADAEIAARHDVSEAVPVLVGESFRDATELRPNAPRLRRVDS